VSLLIIISIIKVFFQFILYFDIQFLLQLVKPVLQEKYLDFITIQAIRNRYFIEIYDTALIPLYLLFLTKIKSHYKKTILALIILTMMFFSILSNYRIHLLVTVVSFILTLLIVLKAEIPKIFSLLLIIASIMLIYIASLFSYKITKTSVIDRSLLSSSHDIKTITGRLNYWSKATEIGLSHPYFGIGLGHYYDYFYPKYSKSISFSDVKEKLMKVTAIHPHNIFFAHLAESGFFGLISYIVMIVVFFASDQSSWKNGNLYSKSSILSFWSLFLFSIVGPTYDLTYQTLFWLLRGLIIITKRPEPNLRAAN